MNEELERVFGEALDLLEQGASVEAILARFPAQAAELRPLFLTTTQLSRLATQPSVAAEAGSKRAFLAAAAAPVGRSSVRATGGWFLRLLAPALAVLAIVLLGGATLVGASTSVVPGSALYGTKRLVENVRLALVGDPERAATLLQRFERERAAEATRLLAEGRQAEVTLTGVIEDIEGGRGEQRWTVAGVPVVVSDDTVIDGTAAPGARVEVSGWTGDGALRASRVVVLSAAPAMPDVAAPATPNDGRQTTDGNENDNGDANANDNDNDENDNASDNGGDDNANANDGDDHENANDNGGDDNNNGGSGDNGGNGDNANDNENVNGDDDNENANGDDDNANDNGDDDNGGEDGSGE